MIGPLSAMAIVVAAWHGVVRPQPPRLNECRWVGHQHDDSFFQRIEFDPDTVRDLKGTVALITGGSSGVGKEVARSLYAQGCFVVVTSRSEDRAKKAAAELVAEVGSSKGSLEGMGLELSDLDDVRRFALKFKTKHPKLHFLVENAGMASLSRQVGWTGPAFSRQGFEMLFASNYLGHFLLFQELLPSLLASGNARATATSSVAHWIHSRDLRSLFPAAQKSPSASGFKQYGNTKLLQVLMCYEAQRRLSEAGLSHKLTVTPVTCGAVNTAINQQAHRDGKNNHLPLLKSAKEGAMTTLYALLCEDHAGTTGVFVQPYFSPKHRSRPLLGGLDMVAIFEVLGQRITWGVHRWLSHPDSYSEDCMRELWVQSMAATGARPVI